MATFRVSDAAAASQVQLVVGSHHRSFHLPKHKQLHSNPELGFKNTAKLQIRQTLFTALASNSNPNPSGAGADPIQLQETKTNDAPQGPPLLTIVAGFLVFFLVCWIVGSTVIWFIGLIVKLFPSN